ncbi:cellulase family glycosylhydrolase [Oxalobacteraceae bacterium]|nr:cellulase family glycosylhydrolase [Oxalobacteraceae bacterium]
MKLSRLLMPLVLALALPLAHAAPITVVNGQFVKDGKPFYGVGVNYFDGFTRYAGSSRDLTWKKGLATLNQYKIPFIRINTFGFWTADFQKNYLNDKAAFYARLDAFMNEAKAQNVGVVLDLFWNYTMFVDLNNEKMKAWGQQNSATRKMMRALTTEIVTRYKGHPALWGWEFSNEANSYMDLPEANNNHQYLPPKQFNTKSTRDASDNFDKSVIISALADFAKTTRIIDPKTPIFSGHNATRSTAYHLQNNKNWVQDSGTQFGEMVSRDNVAPVSGVKPDVDTLTMHIYPNYEGTFFNSKTGSKFGDILTQTMARSKLDKRPFFLGEFGVDEKILGKEAAKAKFVEMTDAIMANRVPMSALWVFDFAYQEGTYNVTSTNSRSYQLDKLKQMNITMSSWK